MPKVSMETIVTENLLIDYFKSDSDCYWKEEDEDGYSLKLIMSFENENLNITSMVQGIPNIAALYMEAREAIIEMKKYSEYFSE